MIDEGEKNTAKYISDEDKKRFEDLFKSLDTNKDGTVDIRELTAALKGRKEPSRQAAVSIDFCTCIVGVLGRLDDKPFWRQTFGR